MCVRRRSTVKECTQDGQGGTGPQETQGRTDLDSKDRPLSAAPTECTQEGQGGLGPRETQGRTVLITGQPLDPRRSAPRKARAALAPRNPRVAPTPTL